jgi:hypothetical protein
MATLRVVTINVQNDEGDPRRTALINRELRRLDPDLAGRSAYYHDAWAVAGDGPGWTWSVDNPNAREVIDQIVRQPNHRRRIDYVLIGSWHAHPGAHCRVKSAELAFDTPVDGVWPSDHFGLAVDVGTGVRE